MSEGAAATNCCSTPCSFCRKAFTPAGPVPSCDARPSNSFCSPGIAFLAELQNYESLSPPPPDDDDGAEADGVDDPALDDELELDDPPHAAARDSTATSVITQI